MTTSADWIRVRLPAAYVRAAENQARNQQQYAARRGFTPKGFGNYDTHLTGALGEFAVALYEGVQRDPDWTWEADMARGHDVAGWQVRTRTQARHGLNLHRGDIGRFLLVYSHERPVMWLAGWLDAAEGFKLGTERHSGTGDTLWWEVDARHLAPLPQKNGWARREARWLVDPSTPFLCDTCRGFHPIGEHRRCRAGSDAH